MYVPGTGLDVVENTKKYPSGAHRLVGEIRHIFYIDILQYSQKTIYAVWEYPVKVFDFKSHHFGLEFSSVRI